MSDFLTGLHLVDGMIAVLLAEALALRLLQRRRRAPLPRGLAASLGSGLCLMLALRLSMDGRPGLGFAALLAAAGLAHALDLWERFRS